MVFSSSCCHSVWPVPEFSAMEGWNVSDSDHTSGPEPGKSQGSFLYVPFHFHQVKDGRCAKHLGSLTVKMSRMPIILGPWPPVCTFPTCTDWCSVKPGGALCTWLLSVPGSSGSLPCEPQLPGPLNSPLCLFSSETRWVQCVAWTLSGLASPSKWLKTVLSRTSLFLKSCLSWEGNLDPGIGQKQQKPTSSRGIVKISSCIVVRI